MTRATWTAAAFGVLVVATVMATGAQEPRKDRDEPQRKVMMMRGMMGPGMPMQGMMPMMMEMHRRHADQESHWEATDDGVFVLRPDTLLKYDNDLKLVKSVDLPEHNRPMMAHPGEERGQDRDRDRDRGDRDEPKSRRRMERGMGGMRQMMEQMHGALPSKLVVTANAVLVSRGNRMMKFSRDLELQKTVDLPEARPATCPMCGHILGTMEDRAPGGRDD